MTSDATTPMLDAYAPIVGRAVLDEIRRLGAELAGHRVLMVSSARHSGGTAETLSRLVPLLDEIGIETRWEVLSAHAEFRKAARVVRNGLLGERVALAGDVRRMYEASAARYRDQIDTSGYDVVVVFGPHPCGLVSRRARGQRWVWWSQYDISKPDRRTWRFMRPMIEGYDASVHATARFASRLAHPQYIVQPSIDPLSPKNEPLSEDVVNGTLERLGVPRDMPIVLQVSRFDHFKDPVGVIEAWQLVQPHQACRLVLAGGIGEDDPAGQQVFEEVAGAAESQPRVHVLRLPFDAHREINALQRAADIVLQKSTKEGFGIAVTEAMYKSRPVVGGAVGGIYAQVHHGRTGFLVHSVQGAAHRVRYLLHRRTEAWRMGQAAHRISATPARSDALCRPGVHLFPGQTCPVALNL